MSKNIPISKELSLLLQCLVTTSFLTELHRINFIKRKDFELLDFQCKEVKEIFVMSGIDNPATMQMMLYALLVVPKEVLSRLEYEPFEDFVINRLNPLVIALVDKNGTISSYRSDNECGQINYIRHIRNAVAHSRCDFISDNGVNFVIFNDANEKGYKCSIKIECQRVGWILIELQNLIFKFYEDEINQYYKQINKK